MTKPSPFTILPNLLPKTDPRYQKWLASLKKRPPSWNTGHTKLTHPSVMKISQTMKQKHLNNFGRWQEEMRRTGRLKSHYPSLSKNQETAELIGLILGDGNLFQHSRTQRLTISFNTKYPQIISRARYLITKTFGKTPTEDFNKKRTCTRMWIYEKYLSHRLGIPCGAKKRFQLKIPDWTWKSNHLIRSCLIGLFNAEGSYSIHLPTCTYNLQFSNSNPSLLKDVHQALKRLKYHPNLRPQTVRLRRREEAKRFAKYINFHYYRSLKPCGVE